MSGEMLALARLLQLASPALPVGAYSYSGGLEFAIEDGSVTDPASAQTWIADVLEFSSGSFELPLLFRMLEAVKSSDYEALARWNELFVSGRETAELRAETLQMGHALLALLDGFPGIDAAALAKLQSMCEVAYPAVYAFAASQLQVEVRAALVGYAWSWLENQVMAALKAVPLGQRAGQVMLAQLGAQLPAVVERACLLSDDELTNFAPGLAIASSRHETQYSRLFRS